MSGVLMAAHEVSPSAEIRQGFLCPFCMDDLGDGSLLQAHVGEFHSAEIATSTNTPAIESIKGFLDKTKQRFRQFEAPTFTRDSIGGLIGGIAGGGDKAADADGAGQAAFRRAHFEPQTIGSMRSHKPLFLRYRDACINDVAVQTNNLIIRLDKLINQCPTDVAKRKDFERDTVPWTGDSESPSCRSCNAKFSLIRRKHHCRLCGKVICQSCSRFLSFVIARKLTNPAFAAQVIESMAATGVATSGDIDARRSSTGSGGLGSSPASDLGANLRQKTGKILSATVAIVAARHAQAGQSDEVSLASLLQQDASEHLRICAPCLSLLERRDEQMDQLASPPVVVQMYERLRGLIADAGNIVPSYARMAESLKEICFSRGESLYTLESATQLRTKLVRLQREIDSLSERITQLGMNDEHARQMPGPREQLLRRNIRQLAVQTVQEMVVNMPILPSEEAYRELQGKYKEKIRRQIDLERQRTQALKVSMSSNSSSENLAARTTRDASPPHRSPAHAHNRLPTSASFGVGVASASDGWRPESAAETGAWEVNPFLEDDEQAIDPLQQQVLVVKGYLKQAAEAGRIEEVEILERNLRDLNDELKRQNLATPRMP